MSMTELLDLRRKMVDEITKLLDTENTEEINLEALDELCPNEHIRREAAEAAASVILAFERGWRQGLHDADK